MRAAVALVLAACGAPPAPLVLASTAPTSHEPVLLFTMRVTDGAPQVRWIAATGGESHATTGDLLRDLAWFDDAGQSPRGRWLHAVHGVDISENLVRARRVGDGVELTSFASPRHPEVSPDGGTVAGQCAGAGLPDGICVAAIEDGVLGPLRHVDTARPDDTVIGWRGSHLVVHSEVAPNELFVMRPTAGPRTKLVVLPEGRYIASSPDGTAFVAFDAAAEVGHVIDLVNPERSFDSARGPGERFLGYQLVSAATLVCSERTDHGKVIAAFTAAGRTEIARDADEVFAATTDRVAFVDLAAHQLVVTDLHGGHRRVLLDILVGARVSPVAWVR